MLGLKLNHVSKREPWDPISLKLLKKKEEKKEKISSFETCFVDTGDTLVYHVAISISSADY